MKTIKIPNMLFAIIVLAVLLIALGTIMASSHRQNAAKAKSDTLLTELLKTQTPLAINNTSECTNANSGVVGFIFRHRDCQSIKSAYYIAGSSRSDTEKSVYSSVTESGWLILDNGRLDNYRFSSDGYLDGIMNSNQKGVGSVQSNLNVHLIDKAKIDSAANLSTSNKEEIKSKLSDTSSSIIQVVVSTAFEG